MRSIPVGETKNRLEAVRNRHPTVVKQPMIVFGKSVFPLARIRHGRVLANAA